MWLFHDMKAYSSILCESILFLFKEFCRLWHIVIVTKTFRECHYKWHCAKDNQYVKHAKAWAPAKIRCSEIELCGNFDDINLPADRMSNT